MTTTLGAESSTIVLPLGFRNLFLVEFSPLLAQAQTCSITLVFLYKYKETEKIRVWGCVVLAESRQKREERQDRLREIVRESLRE